VKKDIPMLASSVTDNGEAVPDGGIRTLMEEVLMGDSLLLLDKNTLKQNKGYTRKVNS